MLAYATSVVYISFKLWTTPNNIVYINIVDYFFNQNKQFCIILLAVRNMHSDHSEKNQVKAILSIFDEYLLKAKLKYFITNNASLNDIYITKIIDLICPTLNAKERKL